jgi:hypothetical protein
MDSLKQQFYLLMLLQSWMRRNSLQSVCHIVIFSRFWNHSYFYIYINIFRWTGRWAFWRRSIRTAFKRNKRANWASSHCNSTASSKYTLLLLPFYFVR